MSGTKRLALLLPVCVLIGFTAALANDGPTTTIKKDCGAGQIVKLAALFVNPDRAGDPAPRPRPTDPQPTLGRPGPAAAGGSAFATGIGSALVTPRGAAMSSPKQHADRQIRKLIRSLD